MNPAIKLRPHQENAVLRGKLGGNTLLAMLVPAYTADKINPKPQIPPDFQQPKVDSGFIKRKAR